jgi:hypothetical protein
MRTLQAMEARVKVQEDPLIEKDFKKIDDIQNHTEKIEPDQKKKICYKNFVFVLGDFVDINVYYSIAFGY